MSTNILGWDVFLKKVGDFEQKQNFTSGNDVHDRNVKGERISAPILWRFSKLKFTYLGNLRHQIRHLLWLPHHSSTHRIPVLTTLRHK